MVLLQDRMFMRFERVISIFTYGEKIFSYIIKMSFKVEILAHLFAQSEIYKSHLLERLFN